MVKLHVSWFHVSFPFFSRDITRPIPLFKTPLCVRNDDALPESFRAHSSLHLMWSTRRSVKAKHVWGWYVPEESEKPSKNILKKLGTKNTWTVQKRSINRTKCFTINWVEVLKSVVWFAFGNSTRDLTHASAQQGQHLLGCTAGLVRWFFCTPCPPPLSPNQTKWQN